MTGQFLASDDTMRGCLQPDEEEDVVLWVQNSHPLPIPAGEIGFQSDGR